jgi:DNA-binding IclR family transcriptional regulator
MAGSLGRMLAVVDIFTADRPIWSGEDLCDLLGYTRATGYRYLKELVGTGFLQRVAGSLYSLGPRIIALDYLIRQADPVMNAAVPTMRDMATQTGCDCIISSLYGDQILDTHRERSGREPIELAYGRGRIRPLFMGAAPKVIIANLPAARLRALYKAHAAEAEHAGLGASWEVFKANLNAIRKRGHHISRGELEPQFCSVAAPLFGMDHSIIGAIQLTTSRERFEILDERVIVAAVVQSGERISLLISRLHGPQRQGSPIGPGRPGGASKT